MRKAKLILGSVILALAVITGWQIASSELANIKLRQDLRDLASTLGVRYGYVPPSTDEQLRSDVIREAKEYHIQLEPKQVTVQLTGTAEAPIIYLAADYKVRVKLPGYSFTLHFTPSSTK
jgi:hypothetical protein